MSVTSKIAFAPISSRNPPVGFAGSAGPSSRIASVESVSLATCPPPITPSPIAAHSRVNRAMSNVDETPPVLHTLIVVCLAAIAVGILGCARTIHSVEPYRSDPQAASSLETRAVSVCSSRHSPLPSREFVTDGCSMFPDSAWVECCVSHDIAYWCGGTTHERAAADRELGVCVAATDRPTLGWWMGKGVRIGGVPWAPTPWRWGYGWDWPKGYEPEASERPNPVSEDSLEDGESDK